MFDLFSTAFAATIGVAAAIGFLLLLPLIMGAVAVAITVLLAVMVEVPVSLAREAWRLFGRGMTKFTGVPFPFRAGRRWVLGDHDPQSRVVVIEVDREFWSGYFGRPAWGWVSIQMRFPPDGTVLVGTAQERSGGKEEFRRLSRLAAWLLRLRYKPDFKG